MRRDTVIDERALDSRAWSYWTAEYSGKVRLSEYRPSSEYERRVLDTAAKFASSGPVMSVFIRNDEFLRRAVERGETDKNMVKNALSERYPFIGLNPGVVSDLFMTYDADVKVPDRGRIADRGTKTESGCVLACGRLRASDFDVFICRPVLRSEDDARSGLAAVLLEYTGDRRWSIYGYVMRDASVPAVSVMAESATRWSCLLGSEVIPAGYALPVCSSGEDLLALNRSVR